MSSHGICGGSETIMVYNWFEQKKKEKKEKKSKSKKYNLFDQA